MGESHVKIPRRLEEKIDLDLHLRSVVAESAHVFGGWFEHSGTPLFPFYTDHGPQHVSDVLASGASLITDRSWQLLTAGDCAAFVLSVLLHDAALHLSEDGFLDLVAGGYGADGLHVPTLDESPWPEVWTDFLYTAHRWDDKQLRNVLGDAASDGVGVEAPPADVAQWDQRHRLLAGEFVRIHHGRLAHEFAVAGVPGAVGTDRIKLSPQLDGDIADVVGLIARSHVMDIRDTFPELDRRSGRRTCKGGVHPVFLMVALRLADYLQVEAARAPSVMLSVKRIRNPLSKREWAAHHAVKHIHIEDDDPEAVVMYAEPQEVHTFLRLRDWAIDFQRELDSAWAALGEVYGRFENLRDLGVVLRRIKSNVNGDVDLHGWPFLPERVAFDVSRPDLLKLMIKPLYGDRAEVGVRELVQNAVDAVRELEIVAGQLRPEDQREQPADVVVDLDPPTEGEPGWLRVGDRGIGMSADVVSNFFLRTGASYRRSDAWRGQFERASSGGDVKPKVSRSGRFGIGALAAFLLGDRILVETRHHSSPAGLRFTTTLDDDEIDLWWDDTLKVGTLISIPISHETWERLAEVSHRWSPRGLVRVPDRWDWYCWEHPTVLRRLSGEAQQQSRSVPQGDNDRSFPEWTRLRDAQGFGPIYWSADPDGPALAVNGLVVQEDGSWGELAQIDNFVVYRPHLALTDPDGRLPLNLQRDRLSDVLPFRRELVESIVDEYARRSSLRRRSPAQRALARPAGVGLRGLGQAGPWIVTNRQVAPLTESTVTAHGISRLVMIGYSDPTGGLARSVDKEFERWRLNLSDSTAVVAISIADYKFRLTTALKEFLFPTDFIRSGGLWRREHLDRLVPRAVGRRVTLPAHVADYLNASGLPLYMKSTRREDIGGWATLSAGRSTRSSVSTAGLERESADGHRVRWLIEWDLSPRPGETQGPIDLASEWRKTLAGLFRNGSGLQEIG